MGERDQELHAIIDHARRHHECGRLAEARALYEKALILAPDDAVALHLYGLLCFHQGDSRAALDLLHRACGLEPWNAGFRSNLGNVLLALGRIGEAAAAFRSALACDAHDPEIHNNLGIACLNLGDTPQAERCFQTAISLDGKAADFHFNLANALGQHERFADAVAAFRAALELDPERAEYYAGLGQAQFALHRWEQAESAYRKAVELRPERSSYLLGLERALAAQGKIGAAAQADPERYGEDHLRAAASGDKTDTAPRDYVIGLFDQYSERYEEHLVGGLQYRAPWLIRQALLRSIPGGRRFANALDLGCGTGLGGAVIRDLADRLTGIDLSLKMAEKASEKNVYDFIRIGDLCDFLNETKEQFDLIVSADVLVYIGNLQPLFAGIRRCIAHGALVAFSTERAEGDTDYMLNPTGRYAHTPEYISSLAAGHGLQVRSMEPAAIRNESGQPVSGTITVLEISDVMNHSV
jgi:predicted TPR repeat methyltransferase